MNIDLHNHSSYSDGVYSVIELLKYAKKKNVDVLGLTDHDTVLGLKEALSEANKYNIKIIPGIELSTYLNNESVHLIGFFKNNYIPKEMYDFSIQMKETRKKRAIMMMDLIKDIYKINASYENLIEKDTITRGNMFQELVKQNPNLDKKYINEIISNKSKAYIEASKLKTEEGIKFLHDNNCIVIYAHPCLNTKKTNLDVFNLDIDGIEYKYPKNQENDESYYLDICNKLNLLKSAGSDFHGDINHDDINTSSLEENYYYELLERLGV